MKSSTSFSRPADLPQAVERAQHELAEVRARDGGARAAAPAASTSGGTGVGPGAMRYRFLTRRA